MIQRLFTPGPVRIPTEILEASAEPPMHHRSADFIECSARVWIKLQTVFRTTNSVALLAGSGMTGIESAIASTMRRGESAVVLVHGRFGERIAHMMRLYGVTPIIIEVAWGATINAADVIPVLLEASSPNGTRTANGDAIPPPSALWMVHGETSTGVALDVEKIARAVRAAQPDILVGVDAVGSLAIHPLETDAWDLDIVAAGIQKGLMCPPGLACVSVSQRAVDRIDTGTSPTYTLDLRTVLASQRKGLFTWTPPVTLIRALDIALTMVLNEGLPRIWKRHADVTHALQEGLRDRRLAIFGDATSHALTAVLTDQSARFRKLLFERHGIVIANGQEQMSGRMVRIGTCGSIAIIDILELFNAIDDVLPLLRS